MSDIPDPFPAAPDEALLRKEPNPMRSTVRAAAAVACATAAYTGLLWWFYRGKRC